MDNRETLRWYRCICQCHLPRSKDSRAEVWYRRKVIQSISTLVLRIYGAQWLPQDYEEKLIRFQPFIIARRKKHDFELKYIGNADHFPLTFDIVRNSTVSEKGVKSISILTTGHEKDRFTVMLACLGDGTKLPPYVIFK